MNLLCGVVGDSIGGSDPHYQVFLELKGVRNLTEEQRYKVRRTSRRDCSNNSHLVLFQHENLHSSFFLSVLSSWTSVSSRTRPSTSRSVSKAASDRWGCSWWPRGRSMSFASAWWPSPTHHPTPSRCTECCAGENTQTSFWGKPFLETSLCGERDKAFDCGERWLKEMSPVSYQLLMNEITNCAFSNTRKQHFWL